MKIDLTRAVLVGLFAFSWACTGTPGEDEGDTDTPTPDAGSPDADVDAGDADSWSFTIVDQELDEDDPTSVAATSISTTTPSWIVVHEDDDGEPGAILGQVSIVEGATASIEITLSRPAVDGELLHAALHVDEGDVGTFEYPDGADTPVVGATGEALSYAFTVTVPVTYVPEAVTVDQVAPLNGEDPVSRVVTIPRVVSPSPAWLVVYAERQSGLGLVLGWSPIPVGESEDVTVDVDRELRPGETLYAVLHTDGGEVGTFEFPEGPDVPFEDDAGEPLVAPSFLVDIPTLTNASTWDVEALDALLVERVVAAEAGWVVAYEESDDDTLGDVLGALAVPVGESLDVTVPITARPLINNEDVTVRLFAEDGAADSFEGTERLITDVAGDSVEVSIEMDVDSSVGTSLYVADQVIGEGNTVSLDQLIWDDASVGFTHIVLYEDNVAVPGTYRPEVLAITTYDSDFVVNGVEFTLPRSFAPGTKLWVVLHDDTQPGGSFDVGADMPRQGGGAPISTTFEILAP